MEKYAIIGYPVKQTLSPVMHTAGFKYFGLPCQYEAKEILPEKLFPTLEELVHDGFLGFNVTIPFKEKVQPLLTTLSPEAKACGAVNVIHIRKDGWFGYNTDAIGVLKTLEPYRLQVDGNGVLILGAGGAARAVLYILTQHFSPSHIIIAGRTQERINGLLSIVPANAPSQLSSIDFTPQALTKSINDSRLIINTTPLGMLPAVDTSPLPAEAPLRKDHILFDAIYRPLQTKFLQQGTAAGATAIGGLTMFLHQGAATFKIWTGRDLPMDKIRQILLTHLS
jgi:shikimate dehydrogenase